MSGDIYLNIDTIVLRGFEHIDRHTLATAVQQALHDHFSTRQDLCPFDLSRVRTNITLPGSFGAEKLGQNVAESLAGVVAGSGGNNAQRTNQGGRRNA